MKPNPRKTAAERMIGGQEAEAWGNTRGEGDALEGLRIIRPRGGVIASRWHEREAAATCQPEGYQDMEA
jgi:hypothetical protein